MDLKSLTEAIKENRNILNGVDSNGKKNNEFNNLKFLRYYLVLYYATISILYQRESDMIVHGIRAFGLYKLGKIAKALRLDYDRTKVSIGIYLDGKERGEIEVIIANDNHRYFTITEKGKNRCEEILKEMKSLDMTSLLYITKTDNLKKLRKYFRDTYD